MNYSKRIMQFLGYTEYELEERILNDWFQWCMDKSYVPQDQKMVHNGTEVTLRLNLNDLQNLVADTKLFNYFKKMYVDCMLDFLQDVEGMNPRPSTAEALQMYRISIATAYKMYSLPLIKQARKKIIENYVK